VFKAGGQWSRCYAMHGDVLAQSGDAAGARRVWAEGLRAVPDLPMIYLHRGIFEMNTGDYAAAQADSGGRVRLDRDWRWISGIAAG